jgi:ribonuclease E
VRTEQPHRTPAPESELQAGTEHAESTPDHDDALEAPQPHADNGGQMSGAQHGSSQESNNKRRRRRRGRRGRRRDGENGPAIQSAGDESQAYRSNADGRHVEAGGNRFPAVAIEDDRGTEAIVPNAPSSPQWSLTDRAAEQRPAAVEHTRLPELPTPVERLRSDEHARAADTSPQALPQPEAESDVPRESRKGWWQRRFKL